MAGTDGGIGRQGACMSTMRLGLGLSTGLSRRGDGRERDSKTAGQKGLGHGISGRGPRR
jgi:hypothetical protein